MKNKLLLYLYIISCLKSSKMATNKCIKVIVVQRYIMSFDKSCSIFSHYQIWNWNP